MVKRWLMAFLVCAAVVVLCIAYADRPLAMFFSSHTAQGPVADFLNFLITPRKLLFAAVVLVAIGSGVWALLGRSLRQLPSILLICVVSAAIAAAIEVTLKQVFGRGDPWPTYLAEHAYGFHWLHGSLGWATFPSGTATVSFAIAATLCQYRDWRDVAFAIAGLLSILVVVLNYHWLSDIIAGGFIGTLIGVLVARVLRR